MKFPFLQSRSNSRVAIVLVVVALGLLEVRVEAQVGIQARAPVAPPADANAPLDSSAGLVGAELSRIGDASHLEFKGLNQWKYDLKADGDRKVILRIAPLDQVTQTRLRTYSDAAIEKVEINDKGVDGTHELVFHLRSKEIEFFDYFTEDPSKLVVDFFPKEEKTKSNKEAGSRAETKTATATTSASKDVASILQRPEQPTALPPKIKAMNSPAAAGVTDKRKPAASEFIQVPVDSGAKGGVPSSGEEFRVGGDGVGSDKSFRHGAFDGGDPQFKRFSVEDYDIKESAIIASRGNIYLRFPTLKADSPHLNTLLKNPPIYEIVPVELKDSEKNDPAARRLLQENKEALLLLTLFKNKRQAVFLRTAKEFLAKYPNSRYDEIVRYMMADTSYDFWLKQRQPVDFESAMGQYIHLSEKYPDSPLATRTLLLTGYSYVDRGDSFGALKSLQRFLRVKGRTKFTDQVKISIAEAYLNLNRFEDALALLDEIERTALSRKDAVEAAYHKGDIFFERKDYAGAVKNYQDAIKKYPDMANQFPSAWYNIAEAEFWQGKFKDSINSYREFLQRFPDSLHGGYAMTRIGELLEIMGAGEKRALGAYMESQFRYRDTPGANIARIRILVQRMPEMKEKEFKNALTEIQTLSDKTVLPDMKEFTTVAVADGQFRRGEFKQSTDGLVAYYQENPNVANREKIQTRIVRNITENIKSKVDKGDFIEALRLYSRFAPTWLKNSDRIDTRYYVGRAYEQAGVNTEAASVYRETLNKLYSIKGTSREKERGIFEVLPAVDALNLRLAQVAARERDYARASEYLKAILNPPSLMESELVERAQVAADVAEARGQTETAKAYLDELVSTWKGRPAAVSDVYLRLAQLNTQTKKYAEAEAALAKIIHLRTDTGLVSDDTFARALELKGDILLANGRRNEGVQAFKFLLESFDGKRPTGSVRYKAGKVLFENGDYKGAETIWGDLKNDSNKIWHKLAQEQLQNAKWRGDYKKYIERIPAMQDAKRE